MKKLYLSIPPIIFLASCGVVEQQLLSEKEKESRAKAELVKYITEKQSENCEYLGPITKTVSDKETFYAGQSFAILETRIKRATVAKGGNSVRITDRNTSRVGRNEITTYNADVFNCPES